MTQRRTSGLGTWGVVGVMIGVVPAAMGQNGGPSAVTVRYGLTERSTFQEGCWDPCACPITLEIPLRGTFDLTATGADPLFQHYAVSNVKWKILYANSTGTTTMREVTGQGTYKVGGEFAVQQQMVLDLQIDGGPVQHFDSGLVVGGGGFPAIMITLTMNNMFCYDQVFRLDAVPLGPEPPMPRHALFALHPNMSEVGLELFTGSTRSKLGGSLRLFLGDPNVPVPAVVGMVGVSVETASLVAFDFEPNLPGITEPLHMVLDPHAASIGALNTLTGEIGFDLHLIAPNGNLPVPMPVHLSGLLTNAGLEVSGDNGNVADGKITMKITAFEVKMPPNAIDIWFSTENGFTAGALSPALDAASPFRPISGGDLLSRRGHIVRTNHELTAHLGIMPSVPDLGLDAVMPARGGQIWFSFEEDTPQIWSETLAVWLKHGDLLSDRGYVVRTNEQLIAAFVPMPVTADVGLDAVSRSANREILFSIETSFFSEGLGRLVKHGDLLSSRGRIVRTNEELLANFDVQHIPASPLPPDYGLDAIVLRPEKEIWFSTEEGFQDANLGPISDGDLLSSRGYVVVRNLELVAAFRPVEDVNNFGLDAVSVVVPVQIADFDMDDDVDLSDFGMMQAALSGPTSATPEPEYGDLDGDGDSDQSDFGLFQACISGPGVAADPDCGE